MSENTINTQITKDVDKEIEFYQGIQVFISTILIIITLIIIIVLFQSNKYKYVHIGYIVVTLIFSTIIIIEYFNNIIRKLENKKKGLENDFDDNRLGMDNLIKNINSFFDVIKKEIVYKDNKYTNIIEDNNDKINELMDILFNRNNKFIIEIQNATSTSTSLDDLREFYTLIKNNNYSLGNIYELKNSELYKICIKSIHHKIFLYNIHQTEFIKTLYEYIENVDFSNIEDPISITKFELLANYKILINNIYEDLKVNDTYSDINKKGYINNLKFCKIYGNFSYDNLDKKIDSINNINNDINTLHTDYEHLIRYEFNKYKNIQNYYEILKNYIITMSTLFLVGLIVDLDENQNNNNSKKNNATTIKKSNTCENNNNNNNSKHSEFTKKLDFLTNKDTNILTVITGFLSNVVLVVFFNVLIISKYNRYKVRNNYNEKLYDLNKEKFSDLLINNKNSYKNNLEIIRDLQLFLNTTPRATSNNFRKISYSTNYELTIPQIPDDITYNTGSDNDESGEIKYYYYYNPEKGILLDDEELLYTHILELYKNNIDLINHYNCCSYVNNYKKEVIFPWDEISINVIIFIMIIIVIATIYKTNGEYNIFEKLQILKEKKFNNYLKNKNTNVKLNNNNNTTAIVNNTLLLRGGTTDSKSEIDLTDSEFIKNMVIIYVFGFYSYRIFSNSLTYYKNYEYIN